MSSYAERAIAAFERLETENAQLRERIHELEMERSDHFYRTAYAEDANRTLETENAKLRELVRDMWHWIEDSNACDVNEHGEAMNCAYCGHYGTVRKGLISCKLYERMRELEVGE